VHCAAGTYKNVSGSVACASCPSGDVPSISSMSQYFRGHRDSVEVLDKRENLMLSFPRQDVYRRADGVPRLRDAGAVAL
jgi:hypothetical protein